MPAAASQRVHGHPRSNRLRLLPISRKEEIKPFAGGAAASRPTPSNGGSARGIPGCKLGQLVAQLRSLVERRGASAAATQRRQQLDCSPIVVALVARDREPSVARVAPRRDPRFHFPALTASPNHFVPSRHPRPLASGSPASVPVLLSAVEVNKFEGIDRHAASARGARRVPPRWWAPQPQLRGHPGLVQASAARHAPADRGIRAAAAHGGPSHVPKITVVDSVTTWVLRLRQVLTRSAALAAHPLSTLGKSQ